MGSKGGTSRVEAKLQVAIEKGNYYEAHQMFRTLYFRKKQQKKFDELLELLESGTTKFLEFDQRSVAADLGVLLIDVLAISPPSQIDATTWIQKIGGFIRRIGPGITEREALIDATIRWIAGRPDGGVDKGKLHQTIATILWDEGNMEQAKHHYLLSAINGAEFAKMLIQLTTKAFKREDDLMIAQTVMQQLVLKQTENAGVTFNTYTKYHPNIAATEPPYSNKPLLNFVFFLLKTIELGPAKLESFKTLCNLYKPSLDRDPIYDKYLQKIGIQYFNAPTNRAESGIFGDIIGQIFNFDELDGTLMFGEELD